MNEILSISYSLIDIVDVELFILSEPYLNTSYSVLDTVDVELFILSEPYLKHIL